MSSKILQVKNPIIHLEDVISQQFHTYAPYSTAFNNNDEIRITIQSQDLYVLPSESYLHIEFAAARHDAQAIGDNDVYFPHLFIAHMFSELRYELNGFEIDRCKTPGITSMLKMLAACQEKDADDLKLFNLYANTHIAAQTYRMIIPLRFLFGFCDDFNKIILNSKHELILVRHRTNLNMYTQQAVGAAINMDINVTKIVWKVPHILLGDGAKLKMLQTISRNTDLYVPFRSWDLYELPVVPQTTRHTWSVKTTSKVNKPRYVIVAFQTNRNNIVGSNASEFDHCNITNLKLYLNNERFPYDDFNLNFAQISYHELFYALTKIQHSYYNGMGGSNAVANWPSYAGLVQTPIFAFDCSKSEESVKPGMVDVRLEIESSANIPVNTSAYCLIIHDNLIRYSPFTSIVQREV